MRKFVISAFITSSVILAAIFGSNEDGKVEVPSQFKSVPSDNHVVEDILIDHFQFVNLEELKSSSTGLIRMSETTEESNTVTGSVHTLEESIETLESDLQSAIE